MRQSAECGGITLIGYVRGGVEMKQGTVVNKGTKPDTLDWLQETIDMLERYKREVEAGEVVITSGDASVTSPVPEPDSMTVKYVSISFDYREV
ncbi:hypothetical protein [Enterococcus diestrammenae]|nr:hypothetical protein [Enterococcus diestrammenae]